MNLSYAMHHFNTGTRFTFPIAPTHSEKNGNIHCNHSNIVFKVISTYTVTVRVLRTMSIVTDMG